MPPAEEDKLLAVVAPEECLFYTAWSGMAEPDPDSTNQTEQLLAEPDVQATIGEIKQQIIAAIRKAADEEGPDSVKLADDAIGAVEQLLTLGNRRGLTRICHRRRVADCDCHR